MKTQGLLLLVTLVLSNTTLNAQSQEFGQGHIRFSEVTNYIFEMRMTRQSNDAISLESDKVIKKTTIKFSPIDEDQDAPYDKFSHEKAFPETVDESVSLTLNLKSFSKYNDSLWFDETDLKFKEMFSPKPIIIGAFDKVAKARDITDSALIDSAKENHLILAKAYTENVPYSNHRVESKVFAKENKTEVITHSKSLSQEVKISFQNAAFFADDMRRSGASVKYLDSFYFSKSHWFLEELMRAASKQKDITYTYYLYSLTGILPLLISRDLYSYDSEYSAELIDNTDGESGLHCVRKSKDRFTCQLTYELRSKVIFPDSHEVKIYSYPAFIKSRLKK